VGIGEARQGRESCRGVGECARWAYALSACVCEGLAWGKIVELPADSSEGETFESRGNGRRYGIAFCRYCGCQTYQECRAARAVQPSHVICVASHTRRVGLVTHCSLRNMCRWCLAMALVNGPPR
jgi:hypothetical protein